MSLAHSHFHRHGAYIVRNADLPGFSDHEQTLLAWLIGGHRRGIPRTTPEHVQIKWRSRLPKMLAVLRIASDLARARQGSRKVDMSLKATDNELRIAFPDGWLAEHPLTAEDLSREAAQLQEIGLRLTFA